MTRRVRDLGLTDMSATSEPPEPYCREMVTIGAGAWIGSGVDTPDIGKLAPGERRMPAHMESAVGVFRALMEDHLPLDILIEPDVENLDTLRQYRNRAHP